MERAGLFPFFRQLSPRGRGEIDALRTTAVDPNAPLLRRGDDAGGAYLVLEGALRVYYLTEEGREATLYRVEPGGTCVLALSSTLSARPYPAWVEASSAGSVFLHILGNTFHRLLEGETAFRSFVLTSMSDRIFELMTTLESLGTSTILQRVAALLLARAGEGVEVRATQAEIAAELGTAREVVFRAIRTLSSRGLLETRRGRVRLLGRAQLQALAKPTAE